MKQRVFEIIPACAAWGTLALLVFLSWKAPAGVVIFIVLYDLFWFLKIVYLFFYLRHSFYEMKKNESVEWFEKLQKEKAGSWERVIHVVLLPTYKEPYELVHETFSALTRMKYPKDKIIVVMGTEERGGKKDEETAQKIYQEFQNSFKALLVTKHPKDIPGEIPGKGSNETWAMRQCVEKIIDPMNISYDDVIVSVFDMDTRIKDEYFGILTHKFLSVEHPLRASYQPIPLFTNNMKTASAFARLIGFTSTFWQFMQQARPEQLVTFSSHATPLRAIVDVGYWHTHIVSEDSRIFYQCLIQYDGDWRVEPLLYPVSMDAIEGASLWESLKNLYKQQRRWGWGVENFPYICTEFGRNKRIPLRTRIKWVWLTFEGFYSWAVSSLIIFLFGVLPNLLGNISFRESVLSYNLSYITGWILNLGSVGILSSAIFTVLLLGQQMRGVSAKEKTMYFLQWLLMPLSFNFFGSFPALDAQTRLLLGGRFRLGFWKTPKIRSEQ